MNNARLESRLLALGVRDSIEFASGRSIAPHKPRVFAYVGSYLIGLTTLVCVIALVARQV